MKKIPLIGTQTLNSISNVKTLISSIDYPTDTVSVIVNNENFDILNDFYQWVKTNKNPYVNKVDISFHPTNLGTPASWNYHFKQYPYCDFFIKADDDIKFGVGDLERFVNELQNNGIVFYNQSITKFACFGITKDTLKKVGLFEENFYPCNFEDDDYNIRIKLSNISESHLDGRTTHIGCGTSKNMDTEQKTEMKDKLNKYIITTEEFFRKKWGGRYPVNYKSPFNNDKISIDNINYNFNYRENKILRCDYTI
jgi:hypothetical protein